MKNKTQATFKNFDSYGLTCDWQYGNHRGVITQYYNHEKNVEWHTEYIGQNAKVIENEIKKSMPDLHAMIRTSKESETKYCIAVGDTSYVFVTDPQLVPMTYVERFDTLREASDYINAEHLENAVCHLNDAYATADDYDMNLHIIKENEINHELCRDIQGDDYRETCPFQNSEKRAAVNNRASDV